MIGPIGLSERHSAHVFVYAPGVRAISTLLVVSVVTFWPSSGAAQTIERTNGPDDDHAIVFELGAAGDWSSTRSSGAPRRALAGSTCSPPLRLPALAWPLPHTPRVRH